MNHDGSAQGGVRWLLRLEGIALCALASAAYARWGMGWGVFAAAFLLPDVAFAGYLAGARIGAACYNATHSLAGPAVCLGLALATGGAAWAAAGLIWAAHIGFDRALGYGLKYAQGFGYTHLGRIGRAARSSPPA